MHERFWITTKFIVPALLVPNYNQFNKHYVSKYDVYSWQIDDEILADILNMVSNPILYEMPPYDTLNSLSTDGDDLELITINKGKKLFIQRGVKRENKLIVDVMNYIIKQTEVIDGKDRTVHFE